MTVAVDIKTGQVVGQVTGSGPKFEEIGGTVRLLTKDGYVLWPRYQVRLETVDSR